MGFENGNKGYLKASVVMSRPNLFPENVATATSKLHTTEGFNQFTLYGRLTSSTEHPINGVGDRCLKAEYQNPYEYWYIEPFSVNPGKTYLFRTKAIADGSITVNAMAQISGESHGLMGITTSETYQEYNMLITIPQDFDENILIFFNCGSAELLTAYFGMFRLEEL